MHNVVFKQQRNVLGHRGPPSSSSTEEILPVCHQRRPPPVFDRSEVQEVGGPVHFVVELLRVGKLQVVLHVGVVSDA